MAENTKLTDQEQAAIEELKKLSEKWPETLQIVLDDEDSGDTLVLKEFIEVARVSGIRNGGILV